MPYCCKKEMKQYQPLILPVFTTIRKFHCIFFLFNFTYMPYATVFFWLIVKQFRFIETNAHISWNQSSSSLKKKASYLEWKFRLFAMKFGLFKIKAQVPCKNLQTVNTMITAIPTHIFYCVKKQAIDKQKLI